MRIGFRLDGLSRDRRGTVALEFALLAIPFFAIIFGLVETGVLAFKTSILEGATREAARQVRTGTVQTSADAAAAFRAEFCPQLFGLFDCATFYFDVRTFASFGAIALPPITLDAEGVPTNATFAPGGAEAVVTVRVIHTHRFFTPFIGRLMVGGDGTSVPLTATAIMLTEPFQ